MAVVPVFVSSTFRDFHGERDVIRRLVAPRLDEVLARLGARVELLDLRWGVDTSAAADAEKALVWGVIFGPSLLQDGDVPEDSWTVLARQQHQWWGTADTDPGDARAARRGWGRPSDPAVQRLPEFYRDDNLRQLRHVLRAVRTLGYEWRPVTRDDQEGAVLVRKAEAGGLLTQAEALEIGEREHTRWYRLRVAGGWQHNPDRPALGLSTPEKHADAVGRERARLHPDLVPWEQLDDSRRSANAEAVQTIVGRLYQWGIVPVRVQD